MKLDKTKKVNQITSYKKSFVYFIFAKRHNFGH